MELLERDDFLSLMRKTFNEISSAEGHCLFVNGEAGIGKTSLIRTFCKTVSNRCKVYQGTCDSLFTPRPLGPVFDIIWQMHGPDWAENVGIADRSAMFTRFYNELAKKEDATIITIEDIHWADEATLDFIKFFARRITRLHCLLILTYRDNEIHIQHPLRNVLGQLPPDTFTRLHLTPLSRQAVEQMSAERGYNGEDVYTISGGNPFYVNEILASYSIGVPDNVRDAVLSSFNRFDEVTKQAWEILSVLPTGLELKYLEKIDPAYATAIHNCLDLKILIEKDGLVAFKHELFRRTIEASLSPFLRMELNKKILDLFKESFEKSGEIERILHHAKNANENDIVVSYAYLAAKRAANLGAHREAAKLYFTAIEYYQENEKKTLIQFYESYAHECYLTSQINEAIIYAGKSLILLKETNDIEKVGNCLHFLSSLYWFNGNRKKSESYASQAIEVLADQPSSKTKAMAYTNMGRLKMYLDQRDECILWSEKAIAIAKELTDDGILCHALISMGTLLSNIQSSRTEGVKLLHQSMNLALKNNCEESIGEVYTNLGSNAVVMKDYTFAKEILEKGIRFCEEKDFDLAIKYLLIYKARLHLETGKWDKAYSIADSFIKNEEQSQIIKIGPRIIISTIKMRRGEVDILPYLQEAKQRAFETREMHRILPVMTALLEYEWLTGKTFIEKVDIDFIVEAIEQGGNIYENSAFVFWLLKARKQKVILKQIYEGYKVDNINDALNASHLWKQLGCPYEQALTLFETTDDNKREAIEIVQKLGAEAVYEKMKFEMRASGIKKIPRGIRKSTQMNPANLTDRELGILQLLKDGLQNKEVASKLFISPKTVDHHISSIFFKLDVNSRAKAVQEALHLDIIK